MERTREVVIEDEEIERALDESGEEPLESGARVVDTIPGAPAPLRLEDDETWAAFRDTASSRARELKERAWDNLAHVEAFAAAAVVAHDVVTRFDDTGTRRAAAHALWPLLPEGARAAPFLPLPDDVAARGPDYRLRPGDVPRIAPSYAAFLGRDDVKERLFREGTGPFLAHKSACPAGARGAAVLVHLEERSGDGFRARVPGPDGVEHTVRAAADGKPILTVDGKAQPVTVSLDVLDAWLFSAGPDARGLDLRSEDDRALLLVWSRLMRDASVRGRSAFAWLEDDTAPLEVRVDVVTAAVDAAFRAVASYATCPLACRITLRPHANDLGWPQRAAELLDDTRLFRDVSPRSAPAGFARDVVWLDALLPPGFVAGRLSAVGAGRAFARLATSLLAPLGVLPLSGMKDGSGAVLLQRLVPVSDDGDVRLEPARLASFGARAALRPLVDAWKEGHGLALPEPRGAPRHDVQQMPAWLTFFLEGLA